MAVLESCGAYIPRFPTVARVACNIAKAYKISYLNLENSELEEIEFSVRQQLSEGKSLLQTIGDALFGIDQWPDEALHPMNF